MKKISKYKIEAIGLFLLLFSFGWQVFEDDMNSLAYETDVYETHEKLDKMYYRMSEILYKVDSGVSAQYTRSDLNKDISDWKDYGRMVKGKERLNHQRDFFWYGRVLIFVLGSIMVIFA